MAKKRSARQQAWARGGLKAIGRATISHYNKHVRPFRPRCGAKRKSDGEPCQNLALAGRSKCRLHGGASPRGDQYHQTQWPNGSATNAMRKLDAKLKRIERNRRAKERRLAKMNPDERAAHEKWHRERKPGSAAERARRRADRKAASELRASLENAEPKPVSPELAALQRQAAELEKERDRLLNSIVEDQGVFG